MFKSLLSSTLDLKCNKISEVKNHVVSFSCKVELYDGDLWTFEVTMNLQQTDGMRKA